MVPDKYQQAWKADAARMHVTIDADLLAKEVQRSHRDFQSTIFWRDIREAGTSLLLIPIWFAMGIPLSLPWTWYLTVPALIWVAGFILVDRRRHPQRSSEPGEPLLFYVKESLTQVEHQIWLLRNVFWWYLLPFAISIMAFFLHVAWKSSSGWWGFVFFAGFLGLFLLVIYGAIYRLNQRAVREKLEPRRQDLLKLVTSLEDETTSEDSDDIFDLVSALADPAKDFSWASWAENWNLIIPSWREATAITLATVGGALCGLWYAIPEMGPVFFQSVVGGVIPFEIAFGWVWLRSRKKQKRAASADGGPHAPAPVDLENLANRKRPRLPRAPAILIIVLAVFIGIMAVLALYRFIGDSRFTGDSLRDPGLDDVSAFGDDDISHLDTWLREMIGVAEYPSLSQVGSAVRTNASGLACLDAQRSPRFHSRRHVLFYRENRTECASVWRFHVEQNAHRSRVPAHALRCFGLPGS